jgi:hypothetical protein
MERDECPSPSPFVQPSSEFHARGAFSLVDLVVTVAVVLLLGGWFGLHYAGEHGRMVRCAWHLEDLGQAMQNFANNHGGALPPAGVSALGATWDMEIVT